MFNVVHRPRLLSRGYTDVNKLGIFHVLTSNSLHTESWLHLSHAIQALNDGPENKKKKKEIKQKKEIHTRSTRSHRQLPLAENEPRAPVLQLLSITWQSY